VFQFGGFNDRLHRSFILFVRLILAFTTVVSPLPGGCLRIGSALMRGFGSLVADFWADESGATAIEYALIAGGIAIAIIASLNAVATAINNTFGKAETAIN
jgi:pilus assembly protein Flp/PilA